MSVDRWRRRNIWLGFFFFY